MAEFSALAVPQWPLSITDSSKDPGWVANARDHDWRSRGPSDDAVGLPSSNKAIKHTASVEVLLPSAKRKFVNVAGAEYSGKVLWSNRPLCPRIELVRPRAADLSNKGNRRGGVVRFLGACEVREQA